MASTENYVESIETIAIFWVSFYTFTCKSLNDIRSAQYAALDDLIDSNNIDVWIAFISGDLDTKYMCMLGSSCSKDITGNRHTI